MKSSGGFFFDAVDAVAGVRPLPLRLKSVEEHKQTNLKSISY